MESIFDGVLANFIRSYKLELIKATGKDLFGETEWTSWHHEKVVGYTTEEIEATWAGIRANHTFWQGLEPYSTLYRGLEEIAHQSHIGHDIYFITDRSGINAKHQTEQWIIRHWPYASLRTSMGEITVLLSSNKGACAKALDLTHYIDDRDSNVIDVIGQSPTTKVFLLNRPWNQGIDAAYHGVTRIATLPEMFA